MKWCNKFLICVIEDQYMVNKAFGASKRNTLSASISCKGVMWVGCGFTIPGQWSGWSWRHLSHLKIHGFPQDFLPQGLPLGCFLLCLLLFCIKVLQDVHQAVGCSWLLCSLYKHLCSPPFWRTSQEPKDPREPNTLNRLVVTAASSLPQGERLVCTS